MVETIKIGGLTLEFLHSDTQQPASCMSVLTPGIGPGYFREMAALLSAGGPPDPVKVKDLMQRYGLVAVAAE